MRSVIIFASLSTILALPKMPPRRQPLDALAVTRSFPVRNVTYNGADDVSKTRRGGKILVDNPTIDGVDVTLSWDNMTHGEDMK